MTFTFNFHPLNLCWLWVLLFITQPFARSQNVQVTAPFSTDSNSLTVWDGEGYTPIFIKGVNLGVAKPGTFPGQLAATREDYDRWLQDIRDAGFNTIRLYTLHFPRFYEALYDFNQANPSTPLYFFQGIWLEEEVPNYTEDLYELTDYFEQEMAENVGAVHGDVSISQRFGKAYGDFTVDVSAYLIGYITAREIHPPEVWHTNALYPDSTSHQGKYFSIENKYATEAWMCARLNHLVDLEWTKYGTQRPVSFSSWPSLDPLYHPKEPNRYEDSVSIDLSTMNKDSSLAGFFASYHAYPYYPDFMSQDSAYSSYYDYEGQNSYLGYLTALKDHYAGIPLVIAEFGSSSSWGTAHYANNGIDHGGSSEYEQGKNFIRMFKNIETSQCAGGIQFAWMDEWFKRTWINDPVDYVADRRILWHNITSAEQNFGIIGFQNEETEPPYFESYCSACPFQDVYMGAGYDFLTMKIKTNGYLNPLDTLYIAFDTYSDSLGEAYLPNGDSLPHRSEFVLQITNETANLLVTEAYDLFGIWHGTSGPEQKYQSTQTDHQPWHLVRWKNNNTQQEIQYIGNLGVNRLNIPLKSTDAVRLDADYIQVKIPWTLLNFIDPSLKTVVHDDRSTGQKEDTTSTGIHFSLHLNDLSVWSTNRFSWDNWNVVTDYKEYKKASYYILQNELKEFEHSLVAKKDGYEVNQNGSLTVSTQDGLLANDLSLDGYSMEAILQDPPQNGWLSLKDDGSFQYQAFEGYRGVDTFTYRVRTASSFSDPVRVLVDVSRNLKGEGFVVVSPNPSSGVYTVQAKGVMDEVEVCDLFGRVLVKKTVQNLNTSIDISYVSEGSYILRVFSGPEVVVKKLIKN